MKKSYICLSTVAILALLATGCSSTDNVSSEIPAEPDQPKSQEVSNNDIDESKVTKDETVYVITKPNGEKKETVVADWLKGITEEGKLNDVSCLTGIKNVKGEETYVQDGSSLVWNCEKEDIHYQGKTDKELPIDVNIEYTLDGKAITPEDLAGKSGAVTMHFTFKNNLSQTVTINDKNVTKYVPFVMLSGMVLPKDNFANVTVDNGKIEETSEKYMAVGYAIPELNEDLGLTGDNAIAPEEFTLTADVTNFTLDTVLSYADSSLLVELAKEVEVSDEDAKVVLSKLGNFVSSLANGESTLYESYQEFLAKEEQLKQGLNQLSNGVDQVYAGVGQLDQGLDQLIANDEALIAGATQTFNTFLAEANAKIDEAGLTSVPDLTIENYSTVLTQTIASLSDENVTAQVQASVRAQVEASYRKQVLSQVLASNEQLTAAGVTADNYADLCANGTIDETTANAINSAVDQVMASDETQTNIDALTAQQMQTEQVQSILTTKLAQAQAGRESLQSLLNSLNSYNQFYVGLKQYIAGVEEVARNVKYLYQSLEALVDGTHELSSSLLEITDQIDEVTKDITEDEINKAQDLLNLYKENSEINLHLDSTVDLAKAYTNFTGVEDSMSSNVKFVYRSDSI